jgi:hypothetical protein
LTVESRSRRISRGGSADASALRGRSRAIDMTVRSQAYDVREHDVETHDEWIDAPRRFLAFAM